jgi:hypothetical protein
MQHGNSHFYSCFVGQVKLTLSYLVAAEQKINLNGELQDIPHY